VQLGEQKNSARHLLACCSGHRWCFPSNFTARAKSRDSRW